MNTRSEDLFENLCDLYKVKWKRIEEDQQEKKPDYLIWLSSQEVIVEVKQLDLSKDDQREKALYQKRGAGAYWPNGAGRLRNAIDDAYPQLRNEVGNDRPGLMVIFDNTNHVLLDGQDVLDAMRGQETVVLAVPEDHIKAPRLIGHGFGGKRKVSANHHRKLSAVGLLQLDHEIPFLTLFHNVYTAVPLQPKAAAQLAKKQFTLPRSTDGYAGWQPINPDH